MENAHEKKIKSYLYLEKEIFFFKSKTLHETKRLFNVKLVPFAFTAHSVS